MSRLFDVIFSVVFLLFFWPFFIIIALIIKIVSPGPAVFKAERVGKNKKKFMLYKFRSMIVDSGITKITTLQNDNRIFSFGKFLRKCKLDETLQIFNVLKSDMSVVGFRPEDVINADEIFVGEYTSLYNIKPGLTSPASLFDYTHGELYEKEDDYIKYFLPIKLEMELYYVQNKSFGYDICIVIRTAKIILQKIFGKKSFNYPPEYTIVLDRIKAKESLMQKIKK